MDENSKPKVEWKVEREIVRPGITLRLKHLPLRTPKFSIEIGQGTGTDFRPRVNLDESGGLSTPVAADLSDIVKDVLSLVAEAQSIAKEASDRREAWQRQKDAAMARQHGGVRAPGKTAREVEKRKRWEQNRIAKADENRKRASTKPSK